jgi:dimethylargininase
MGRIQPLLPAAGHIGMRFTRAIVRPPGNHFAEGLTTSRLGAPELERALIQHERYCAALVACGLDVHRLPADDRYPDGTFVEDTAIITARGAMITRPGAPSRAGETNSVRDALLPYCPEPARIEPPGTVDGGDVCQAEDHFFVGLSRRTNSEGARQLAQWLESLDYTSCLVDVRGTSDLLHLKSGLSYVGDGRLLVTDALADHPALRDFERIRVPAGEDYAANCVQINERVLIATGHPGVERILGESGYRTLALDMSEFRKMDGGLSCLSLRF